MSTPPPVRTVRTRASESKTRPRVSSFDTLLEALKLVDEAEAVADLLDAYLAERGPQLVHAAARALGRTARQIGSELGRLVESEDHRRFMQRAVGRKRGARA